MNESSELAAHVVDLLAGFGPCEARRMFGGHGIFHEGLMFALIAGGTLYLKADDHSRARFLAEGSEAFGYDRQGKRYQLSYYTAPEAFFEDGEACRDWARRAFDAALRNPPKQRKARS